MGRHNNFAQSHQAAMAACNFEGSVQPSYRASLSARQCSKRLYLCSHTQPSTCKPAAISIVGGLCGLHPEITFRHCSMTQQLPKQGQWPPSLVNNKAQHSLVSRGPRPGAACALATGTAQHSLRVIVSSSGHRVDSHCSARPSGLLACSGSWAGRTHPPGWAFIVSAAYSHAVHATVLCIPAPRKEVLGQTTGASNLALACLEHTGYTTTTTTSHQT